MEFTTPVTKMTEIMTCCDNPECERSKYVKIHKQLGKKKFNEYWYALAELLGIWKGISGQIVRDEGWVSEGLRLKVCKNSVVVLKLIGMVDAVEETFLDMTVGKGQAEGLTVETCRRLCGILITVTNIKCGREGINDRPYEALRERLLKLSEICNFDEKLMVRTTNLGKPSIKYEEINKEELHAYYRIL